MSDDTRSPETRSSRTPWNKGKLTGPKPPLKSGRSGPSGSACSWRTSYATSPSSTRDRQQAAWLRPGRAARPRCRARRHRGAPRHRPPAQDPAAGAVRADRPDSGVGRRVDHPREAPVRGISVPSRVRQSPHLTTRQYAWLVNRWWRWSGSTQRTTAPTRCAAPRRR